MNSIPTSLVIGAGSALARATINELLGRGERKLIAVSRSDLSQVLGADRNITTFFSDYSEDSIGEIITGLIAKVCCIDQVFIFNGILHSETIAPEKRLEQLSETQLLESFKANSLIPLLWLKHLKRLLRKEQQVVVTILSARVGSISHNNKGGWYSYRAAKAALNMMVKSASIEYQREAKNVSFLVYHPGTTDTPLSKPFQRNVPKASLFQASDAAIKLLDVVDKFDQRELIQFRDWKNDSIDW